MFYLDYVVAVVYVVVYVVFIVNEKEKNHKKNDIMQELKMLEIQRIQMQHKLGEHITTTTIVMVIIIIIEMGSMREHLLNQTWKEHFKEALN